MSRKKSYPFKFWFCAVFVSITALIYTPIMVLEYRQVNQNLSTEISALRKIFINDALQSTLGFAIETSNVSMIQSIIDSVGSIDYIHNIAILDSQNNILAFANNAVYDGIEMSNLKFTSTPIYVRSFVQSEAIENNLLRDSGTHSKENKKLVGYLQISSTSYWAEQQANSNLLDSLLFTMLVLVSSFFFLWAIFRLVNKHIVDSVVLVKRIAEGGRGVRFSQNSKVTEISQFAESLNQVALNLDKAWEEIDAHEELYIAKNNILQIAAHEIRTPINSLKTYLDMVISLNKSGRFDDASITLKKCFSDIALLDKRVTSILALSALEQGVLKQNSQWVNSEALFADLARQFEVKCASKPDLSLICVALNGVDRDILIDIDLTTTIIANAIDNAIKFTDRGSVLISYEFSNDAIIVCIKDSGIGLSQKEIATLMTIPNQLQNDIRRSEDGWGIGISTMHRFTEFLGGTLSIESAVGIGSMVRVSIPAEIRALIIPPELDDLLTQQKFQITDDQFNESGIENSDISVLVIDNDRQHLQQMKMLLSHEFLRRSDVQSTFIEKPIEALEKMEKKAFDLIIIDYHMPNFNGLELLQYIAGNETRCQSAYKVILTADTNIPIATKNEILSFSNEIISKGVTADDIRNLIRQVSLRVVDVSHSY